MVRRSLITYIYIYGFERFTSYVQMYCIGSRNKEVYVHIKCVFFSEGFKWFNEITIQLTLRKLFVSIYTKLFLY